MTDIDDLRPTDPQRDLMTTFELVGEPPALGALFSAMARARAAFPPIPKSATGQVPGRPSFKYSSLTDITNAISGPLGEQELAFAVFPASSPRGTDFTLLHWLVGKGEARIQGTYVFRNPRPSAESKQPQIDEKSWGATLTYARRYITKCIWSIEGDDDADNASAPQPHQPHQPHQPKQTEKPRQQRRPRQQPPQEQPPQEQPPQEQPPQEQPPQEQPPQDDPNQTINLGSPNPTITTLQLNVMAAFARQLGYGSQTKLRNYVANSLDLQQGIAWEGISRLTSDQGEILIANLRSEASAAGLDVANIEHKAISG